VRKDTDGPGIPGSGTTPSPGAELTVGGVVAEISSRAVAFKESRAIVTTEIEIRSKPSPGPGASRPIHDRFTQHLGRTTESSIRPSTTASPRYDRLRAAGALYPTFAS